jgi:hypothetical protein
MNLCTICYIGGKNLGETSAGHVTALVLLFAALILNVGFIAFLLIMTEIKREKQREKNRELRGKDASHYNFVQKGRNDKTSPNSNLSSQ